MGSIAEHPNMQQQDNSEVLQVEKMDEHDAFSENLQCCLPSQKPRKNKSSTDTTQVTDWIV